MGLDIEELSWLHASKLTEEKDKRKVLEWFVKRVNAGENVNSEVMKFIAAGIEQHLSGKKPWGAKQGVKKDSPEQEMFKAFPIYKAYQRIGIEILQNGKHVDPVYVLVTTAEEFSVSEDTVRRAIKKVRELRKTVDGRALFEALSKYQLMQSLGIETSKKD